MLISMNIGAYYEYLRLKVKIFLELLEKKCNLIYVNKYKVIIMKNFTIILSFFLCFTLVADDHKDKKETMKNKFMNNPNYLMDFKECKELKDGVFGLLSLCDKNEVSKRKILIIFFFFFTFLFFRHHSHFHSMINHVLAPNIINS